MKKIISPITGKSKYLLIENCEIISDIRVSQDLKESLQLSSGKNGTLIVKNLPGTILNRENQNGRIYSTQVLAEAIRDAKPYLETKQLLSQACEHPEGSFVSPTTASHVVTNAYIKKNVRVTVDGEPGTFDMLFMDIEVLNTEEGKNLRALLEAECSVGTSIRGVGDMEGKYVKNYEILGIDFVGNPSSSTFTRMPVSESVKLELADDRALKETFTVTTSSTNVTRDLEQAAALQQQLEAIGYGTVTKTSTKLDQETDPKTGAQTSITTLEAETSDDVSDLDQALQMAKNAMLNGTVNVDSVTIENVPEDGETKESVEYIPEEVTAGLTEAKKEDEEDPNLGRKFVLKAGDRGYVTFDKNAINFTKNPEDALHFTQGHEENGMVSMSKVTEILDAMGEYDVKKYFQRNNINLGGNEKPKAKEEGVLSSMGTVVGAVTGIGAKTGHDIGAELANGTSDQNVEDTSAAKTALGEENGSSTMYRATVVINDANGSKTETIPVSATDLENAKKEIANLYDMKSKTVENGTLEITLIDTTTGEQMKFNGQSGLFESGDGLEVDGDKTEVEVDDDTTIEKEFDSPIQAKVAAAAVEKGKADPKILVPEAAEDDGQKITLYATDGKVIHIETNWSEVSSDFVPDEDPYFSSFLGKDVESAKNEIYMDLSSDNYEPHIQVKNADDIVIKSEACDVDEKLYAEPSEPSDDLVKTPLKEEPMDLLVTLKDIDWDFDKIGEELTAEDLKELVDVLPDPWTIRVNSVEIDNANTIEDLRAVILKAANEQAPWAIKNAVLDHVDEADTGLGVYDKTTAEAPVIPDDYVD